MTATDDRLILGEYSEWRAARFEAGVDLTPEAFVAEREAAEDKARVVRALAYLAALEFNLSGEGLTETEQRALDAYQHLSNLLVDGREYHEERSITSGVVARHF